MSRYDQQRDTQCSACYLWTHRLTDGTVRIFCDKYCAARYDEQYGTSYAFDRYHYIPLGWQAVIKTTDVEVAYRSIAAWLSQGSWSSNPVSQDQAQDQFSARIVGNTVVLTRVKIG